MFSGKIILKPDTVFRTAPGPIPKGAGNANSETWEFFCSPTPHLCCIIEKTFF